MSVIVLMSMPADRPRVEPIADALLAAQLDVRLYDFGEAGGPDAGEAARCCIFCWSDNTAGADSEGYRAFAVRIAAGGRAIGVAIDKGAVPPADAPMTTYGLAGRQLRPGAVSRWLFGDLHMRDVIAAAKTKAAGIDPPPPTATARMLRRQAWAVLVAVGALWGSFTGLESINDRIPWPRYRETAAWQAIKPGSCDDLRVFLLKFPDGANAARARTVLAAPKAGGVAGLAERMFPVGDVLGIPTPDVSEAAAQQAARTRLMGEAARLCSGYARTAVARLAASRTGDERLTCRNAASGWTCQIEGQALCAVEEMTSVQTCLVTD